MILKGVILEYSAECSGLEGLIFNHFYLVGGDDVVRTDFQQFSLMENVVVLKGLILDHFYLGRVCLFWKDWFWIIGWFCFTTLLFMELQIVICICLFVACHRGQSFWLIWPMANLANAIMLHHHHCKCWHYHLLCRVFLVTWFMPVSSCCIYIGQAPLLMYTE